MLTLSHIAVFAANSALRDSVSTVALPLTNFLNEYRYEIPTCFFSAKCKCLASSDAVAGHGVYSIPILFFIHCTIFDQQNCRNSQENTQKALSGRGESTGMNAHKEESVVAIGRGAGQVLKKGRVVFSGRIYGTREV